MATSGLAAAVIAAGMWPPRNRRAVNKQRYGCTSNKHVSCFLYGISPSRLKVSWTVV